VSQVLRAIARKSGDAWEVVGPDFVAGSKAAARMLPPLAVIALITTIAGPIAGLAGLLRSDLFKSVHSVVTTVRRSASKQPSVGAGGERPRTAEKLDLTPRELAVMDLLREAKPNKQIGIELKMQESTVKVHVRNIMKKLRSTTA
jgi:DNA-binding CsgD family transcriptional regulator